MAALKDALHCKVGVHTHNNLGMAIANVLAAIDAGAEIVDGSLRAFGAGGGNASTETLVAVFTRLGIETGMDLYKSHGCSQAGRSLQDAAQGGS